MNYTELQQAILDDTHKSQYAGAPVQRFIAQGEALISAYLESYNFLSTLTDSNRISAGSPTYNLPSGLSQLRYVKIDGRPLDKVDETGVYVAATDNFPHCYVQRVGQIVIAGTPAAGKTIDIDYMGMPDPLSVTATNALLNAYPQLYQEAAAVYVFKRAQDYESADVARQSVLSLCAEINRKVKKLLGGSQAVGPYNVSFRSSY